MDHVSTQPLHDLAKTLERLTPNAPMPTIGEYGEYGEYGELVRRIFSTDPDERMPPPESHKQLDEAQKELLKRWISEGAEYQPHWAFILPKKSPPPAVEQNRWARNSIDGFILARFEREPTRSTNDVWLLASTGKQRTTICHNFFRMGAISHPCEPLVYTS